MEQCQKTVFIRALIQSVYINEREFDECPLPAPSDSAGRRLFRCISTARQLAQPASADFPCLPLPTFPACLCRLSLLASALPHSLPRRRCDSHLEGGMTQTSEAVWLIPICRQAARLQTGRRMWLTEDACVGQFTMIGSSHLAFLRTYVKLIMFTYLLSYLIIFYLILN